MGRAHLTLVTPAIELSLDTQGLLILQLGERRYCDVAPVRAFPFSEPERFIALKDAQGRELVLLEDLEMLSPRSRQALIETLFKREFSPIIRRIIHVPAQAEPSEWQVETDRGETRFVLKSEHDIRRIGAFAMLITDSHGIRYRVPDVRRLDRASRQVLQGFS